MAGERTETSPGKVKRTPGTECFRENSSCEKWGKCKTAAEEAGAGVGS